MSDVNVTNQPADVMLAIVRGTIGAIGIPGNVILMIMIAYEYNKRKPHEWLLFLMAFTDFMACLNNVALEAPFMNIPYRFECKVAGFLEYSFGVTAFLTPLLVSYNRYLSLYNNPLYVKLFTVKSVFISWGFIFLAMGVGLVGFPFAVTGNLGKEDLGHCGVQVTAWYLAAFMGSVCMFMLIGYIFHAYFCYKVVVKIRNHKQTASQNQLQSRLINESKEIITVMIILSITPLLAQITAVACKMLQIIFPLFNPWISRSLVAPYPFTSAANAYVTMYIVKEYKRKINRFLKRGPISQSKVGTAPVSIKAWSNDKNDLH